MNVTGTNGRYRPTGPARHTGKCSPIRVWGRFPLGPARLIKQKRVRCLVSKSPGGNRTRSFLQTRSSAPERNGILIYSIFVVPSQGAPRILACILLRTVLVNCF